MANLTQFGLNIIKAQLVPGPRKAVSLPNPDCDQGRRHERSALLLPSRLKPLPQPGVQSIHSALTEASTASTLQS